MICGIGLGAYSSHGILPWVVSLREHNKDHVVVVPCRQSVKRNALIARSATSTQSKSLEALDLQRRKILIVTCLNC